MSWLSKAFTGITGKKLSAVTPALATVAGTAVGMPWLGAAAGVASKVFGGMKGGAQPMLPGIAAGAGLATRALPMLRAGLPAIGRFGRRVLPSAGIGLAAGAAGQYAVGGLFGPGMRRRRGRGFSARDVRQTRRMLKLIKEMGKLCGTGRKGGYRKSSSCSCS